MRKLNRILVPIDFSEESARALRYALSLARRRGLSWWLCTSSKKPTTAISLCLQ